MLDEKSIDTAPRDGSAVMLWCDDGVWRKATWLEDDVWMTTDGEMRIKGTLVDAPEFVTARLWAPLVTEDDAAAQAAIAATALDTPTALPK
ncbi:hypothetical protein VE25_10380 [Devosia geojensis]|uniref:Uncharacterized protein n=1 Tax=Devosia geojensis TaxID=443610 RepID=A0A0F5FUJ3_9HYPH|nr:hypothetical protein [Devosia geojensis]KKB11862.1 hypothetical protein VE25_10380 [Devosia geojensis]